jgi:hypothetical protein
MDSYNEDGRRDLLPNLLIIGAAKSGTSSLYNYLGQHPDVFMSTFKEPTFFIWNGREYNIQGPGTKDIGSKMVTDLDSYLELFVGGQSKRIRGEASPGYLHTSGAAESIRDGVPDAKLIAILRNPIDRAYSAFLHARRTGIEPLLDIDHALDAEPERVRDHWIGMVLYTTVGMYSVQLERYLAVFPREQLRVYIYDDLVRDSLSVCRDAFRFLDVDDTFEPDTGTRHNTGRGVRSPRLHMYLQRYRKSLLAKRIFPRRLAKRIYWRINERKKQQLAEHSRLRLARTFEPDLSQLSQMLGRDLSPWLEGKNVMPPRDDPGVNPRPVSQPLKDSASSEAGN